MNTYSTKFFSHCPTNGVRIEYNLTIETETVVMVEDILEAIAKFTSSYHEALADEMFAKFGGVQTIVAFHHGVEIKTVRK